MDKIRKSKQLAYLLRHDTGYSFDRNGWRTVGDLVSNHGYTLEELKEIVATNDKKRFEFNENLTMIRARQGQSVNVDVELKQMTPPAVLYHGTAEKYVESIMENGIMKQNRLYVHLSSTIKTATAVGTRHGNPVIIEINAAKMAEDGCVFYLSRNGVWLTEYVDIRYCRMLDT